jgi:hypothetical protein
LSQAQLCSAKNVSTKRILPPEDSSEIAAALTGEKINSSKNKKQ